MKNSLRIYHYVCAALMMLAAMLVALPAVGGEPLTVCHGDGRVTFRYRNDNARSVMVDVQFAGRHAMERDGATGLWTVTLGPAAPDLYPYCFIVDGVSVMDPACDLYFPNEGFKNSLLDNPSPSGGLLHEVRDVGHGSLSYASYYSTSLCATNHAIVYLPPSYMSEPERRYPVFYLISGTTDTEEVYYKVGRVNYILDNLIAEGAAEEMIVVLPYGNPMKLQGTGVEGQGSKVEGRGSRVDVFGRDLTCDLMPYVESHFRTINDADHRAIGGFSRGGNQGLMYGLTHLDKFSYLCSYSSFTSMDLPGVYDQAVATNGKLHLFWLGVGTDDFLYGTARDYMEFLDKKSIRTVKAFTHDKFGHTWMNARYFLDCSLRLLFKPEVAEAAMQHGGEPTPVATGHEQAFTSDVMVRLFPRPILSPEYGSDAITFRMKAPEARAVSLVTELLDAPLAMERDSDGVWQVVVRDNVMSTFTYYYLVDGTPVADPQNMYLAPSRGFKPSICCHPSSPNNFASMGNIPHGTVNYFPALGGVAWYVPADFTYDVMPVVIQLIPGEDDTDESWFKVGAADAIADRLNAREHLKPFLLTTNAMDFSAQQTTSHTLRASDYKTWTARQQALEKLLETLK